MVVKYDGLNLRYVDEDMGDDKGIIKAAVKQNGDALEFASGELKNDRQLHFLRLKMFLVLIGIVVH